MNTDAPLAIVTAPRYNARHWKPDTVTWGDVIAWTETPADTKECWSYVLGTLARTTVDHTSKPEKTGCEGYHRRRGAVVSRSAVTLDIDYPVVDLPARLELALPWAGLVHTTWRATPDKPRYRLILPTDREMAPEEYHAVASVLMEDIGLSMFDPGSVQAERYMFGPSAQHRDWFGAWVLDGDAVPVDETMNRYDPDLTRFPMPAPAKARRSPFELDGVVGAFNRVYVDLEALTSAYDLPYETAGADRWHLVGARGQAGMGPVAGVEGLFYSHHAGDPAYGQTVTAFDLVRLHRFGEMDVEASPKTPINRLPSVAAMRDLAAVDHRVVAELVGVDFDASPMDALDTDDVPPTADEVSSARDWRLGLRLDPKTGLIEDTIANWDLVTRHDEVFAGLYFNELTLSVEVDRDLPWRPLARGGATLSNTDRAALAHYLERRYQNRLSRLFVSELIDTTAQGRFRNPIREYLRGLSWDGVPRLEESLPGVEPTPYTRMVARKVLVAAVARMLDPGVKWDHSLVLFGPEGIGKTHWVERMSRGYYAELGPINAKDTLLAMQRSWIMVADEGHSLRKTDADAQKEFLTRRQDVFRLPYEREAVAHPRHCVIWSTTNDEVFLRRQEGNRRFLIVRCTRRVDFESMTDEYVAQVWAEAVTLYDAGEQLFLDPVASRVAAAEREGFTEEDALGGLIAEYAETLVPDDWGVRSPESRALWLLDAADGMGEGGSRRIETICTMQVWVEVLQRRRGDHRRADLLDITAALKRLPGWRARPGRERVPGYGPQQVFERIPADDFDPEELI